jgi:hypothetical protein
VDSLREGFSPYIPDPPYYRRTTIKSDNIDTLEMAHDIAEEIYNQLNRLRYTATASVEGTNQLRLGQTVALVDVDNTTNCTNYFLQDYSTTHDSNGWVANLTCVGGVGDGSTPTGNSSPVALIELVSVTKFTDSDSVDKYTVVVSGKGSKDYDVGDVLSYLWEVPTFDNITTVTTSYTVPATETSISITLTVTDSASPPLSDSFTLAVTLDTGIGTNISTETAFLASASSVYETVDGGSTWVQEVLY